MRLLFDENLSPSLGRLLSRDYPGSIHVRAADLIGASDVSICAFAREHNLIICTRDYDFVELADLLNAAPHIIYLLDERLSAAQCAERLLAHKTAIEQAFANGKVVYVIGQ